ncbi:hypothetical protein MLD38_030096 [Melastoma candidum]|uniref:Uncharacterized protein n=1 Tax=Melastoma candidum TaxID=119954 RepID=A0ACB9MKG2_9MYRT|nr:hypothetical protein MLD38_030096 [Melastoma candidum]
MTEDTARIPDPLSTDAQPPIISPNSASPKDAFCTYSNDTERQVLNSEHQILNSKKSKYLLTEIDFDRLIKTAAAGCIKQRNQYRQDAEINGQLVSTDWN